MLHRAIVFVAISLALAGCRKAAADAEAPAEATPVSIEVARVQTLRATVSGPGIVGVAASGDWLIFPAETGRIVELTKKEGDAVSRDDVLVRFDYGSASADLGVRQIALSSANGALDAAKRQFARVSAMNDRGYTSRNDFDAAKAEVAAAELNVARAKEQLEAAGSAVEHAVVKARFSGVIAKRFHNEGDLVNPSMNDPVLRVVDPSRAQVAMVVPVQDLMQIQLGQTATIVTAQGAQVGTVALRPTPSDPHAATQEIRIAFANPTALPLDSPVQVEVLIAERPGVVALPLSALLRADDGRAYVMVAGVDGRAHRRDVRTGLTTHERVEIIAGVTSGDRVIVKNPSSVAEGAELTIGR